MKSSALLALLLILGTCFVETEAAGAGALAAICPFYSKALGVTNNFLVSKVVTEVVGKALASPKLVGYFNGSKAGTSVSGFDFTTNTTAYNNLFLHLVQFFGMVLGCNDTTILTYGGLSMAVAHNGLNIPYADYALFNQFILDVLTNNGVVATDVTIVAAALDVSFRATVCATPDCTSLCNKYSVQGISNNAALISAVVVGTEMAAFGSPILLPFFNGSIQYPGVTNYVTNTTAAQILTGRLIAFFGMVLGCSDGSIGNYTGTSLAVSHAFLPINNLTFVTFNNALVAVLAGAGVSAADQATIAGVLESTRAVVCTQPDCFAKVSTAAAPPSAAPVVTTPKADAGSLVPVFLMAVAAIALLL